MFTEQASVVDSWVISDNAHQNGSSKERMIRKAKVSSGNNTFLFYSTRHEVDNDSLYTKIVCYNAQRDRMILNIDDAGQADVLYNGRHRIFSKGGKLLDVFVELK